jgi:hypothetical protein
VPLFRKKPVVIEAVQVPQPDQLVQHGSVWGFFYRHGFKHWKVAEDKGYDMDTGGKQGWAHASPGDWIVCGVQGEFYPCKADIFAATYDPLEPPV